MRTEHSRTPLQLIGDLADTTAPLEEIDPENYGIDEEEEAINNNNNNNEINQVQCDPIECPLNEEQLLEFKDRVPVLSLENSYNTLSALFYDALKVMIDIYGREEAVAV